MLPSNTATRPTVLIVDDEPNIVLSLEFLLKREGFNVFSAGDGETGWTMAQSNAPAVILLDVMLPKRDGYELCQMLRTAPHLSQTKIIMLSAKGRDEEICQGMAIGADAYMTKPFSTQAVVNKIRHCINQV